MNTKKILSWIALLGGEAIIIAAWILFGGSLTNDALALNIIVTSLCYGAFFVDILVPWIDMNDPSHRKVGSIGARWFFTWLYVICAAGVMLLGNYVYQWSFASQIIIQAGLLFLFILGIAASLAASDKVREIYEEETLNRNGIDEMKYAVRNLKDKMNRAEGLPAKFIDRINNLEENLRFLSPANTAEARDLERSFSDMAEDISFAVSDYSLNADSIEDNLKKAERIYQNRKSLYSN